MTSRKTKRREIEEMVWNFWPVNYICYTLKTSEPTVRKVIEELQMTRAWVTYEERQHLRERRAKE